MKQTMLTLAASLLCLIAFAYDTTYLYYNRRFAECSKDTAIYYARLYQVDNNWKKQTFTVKGDVMITEGSFTDRNCRTPHGIYNAYKDGMLNYSIEYINGKLVNRTGFYENGRKKSFIELGEKLRAQLNWDENGNEIQVPVFDRVEIEAHFPGGPAAWQRYLESHLNARVAADARAPVGSYTVKVQFIVSKEGDISNVQAVDIPASCYACAREAVRVIKKGPKWVPAVVNGQPAMYQATQYITFQVAEE